MGRDLTHGPVMGSILLGLCRGAAGAAIASMAFCVVVSALVFAFARPLIGLFVEAKEAETILEGVRYLRIEGAFYRGIGRLPADLTGLGCYLIRQKKLFAWPDGSPAQ